MKLFKLYKSFYLVMLFLLVFVLSGCFLFQKNSFPPADLTNDNINVMLTRTDGWKKIIDEPLFDEWRMKYIDGSTATIPITAEILRQFYDYSDEKLNQSEYVKHSTTHNAYINLIDKDVDKRIIFVTPPSVEELAYAEEKDVELDLRPIARDAFVFITHIDNPIDSLTVEQIQKIYSGEITNWKDLGGNDSDIFAYQREPNSGSQTAMENLVMQGVEMVEPITTKTRAIYGMGSLVDAVAEYQNGPSSIGYTYNYYINNLYKSDLIKTIKINGISPSSENLISSIYPFTTAYYGVIRKDSPEESYERKLLDFLETKLGQDLIAMAGYVKYKE